MTTDIGYYWLRIMFYLLVAITVGTLFFRIGTDNNSILARGKCVSFIYGFMLCMSCGGLPSYIEELKVFYYEEAAFVVSISFFSGIIMYSMVQLHPASVVPNVLMGIRTGSGLLKDTSKLNLVDPHMRNTVAVPMNG
ncbi:hypothetical protein VNO78_17090 [Psophocarpus tetragonolobus]|uniref:ABC-2 type transporter transmembrane domain-containing protein n=1 Tax=Psophocarpus tetragonolobus TaxID=3891 RepID=A0AAN9SHG6_PSOTE